MVVGSLVRKDHRDQQRRTARNAHRDPPLRRTHLRMTTVRRLLIALLASCACSAAVTGVALADGDDVLRDCNDNGKLDQKYGQGDLRDRQYSVRRNSDRVRRHQRRRAPVKPDHGRHHG